MKEGTKWLLTAMLCGVSAWLAWEAGSPKAPENLKKSPPKSRPSAAQTQQMALQRVPDPDLDRSQAIARCTTAALWKWMEENASSSWIEVMEIVAKELVDREGGAAAVEISLRLEDPKVREAISEALLAAWSKKDPWAAYAIYGKYRGNFEPGWGSQALSKVLAAACEISADRVIEVFTTTPGKASLEKGHFGEAFEFVKLADFFNLRADAPYEGLGVVVDAWADREPLQAVKWCLTGAGSGLTDEPRQAAMQSRGFHDLLAYVVASHGADRDEALKLLMQSPEYVRGSEWGWLAEHPLAEEPVKLDPNKLTAAAVMDASDQYLVPSLLETRGEEKLDPSWQAVPEELRAVVLEKALGDWLECDSSPAGRKAQAAWRGMVEKSWGR